MSLNEALRQEIDAAAADYVQEQEQFAENTKTGTPASLRNVATAGAGENQSLNADADDKGQTPESDSQLAVADTDDSLREADQVEVDGDGGDNVGIPESWDTLSEAAITRALDAGLRPEDIASFPTEKLLLRACDLADRARKLAVSDASESKKQPVDEGPSTDTTALDDLPEDGAEMTPFLRALVGELRAQRAEIAALRGEQGAATADLRARRQGELTEWFDRQVAELGPEYQAYLGEGTYSDLDPRSPAFAKREAIANHMSILLGGYRAAGQEPPPRDDLFQMAVRSTLSQEAQQVAERKLQEKLQTRKRQHISRASRRESIPSGGDTRAQVAQLLDDKYFKGST